MIFVKSDASDARESQGAPATDGLVDDTRLLHRLTQLSDS